MKTEITLKKVVLKPQMRQLIEKKLQKIEKFFGDEATTVLKISQEKERKTVELTTHYKGMYFRAEDTSYEILDSVDQVIARVIRQIRKNKTKLEKSIYNFPVNNLTDNEDDSTEEKYDIIKRKQFEVKAMSVEEAILRMNMLDHQFFMFLNEENGLISLAYKRKNGGYGLLEPDMM